jgi:hypothetical protein
MTVGKAWDKSTQERLGKDQRPPFGTRKTNVCQSGKWPPHHSDESFQYKTWPIEGDLRYAIPAVFQRRHDVQVVNTLLIPHIPWKTGYDNREGCQISRDLRVGVPPLQVSKRCRRRGDVKTTFRHPSLRQTCSTITCESTSYPLRSDRICPRVRCRGECRSSPGLWCSKGRGSTWLGKFLLHMTP